MAPQHLSPEQLRSLQDFVSNWGKIVARRAADHAPNLSFREMEHVASVAALGLVQGTLQALLEQHTGQLGEQQPCPDCQRCCPVQSQPRSLSVVEGNITFNEPFCHCPGGRRDFFPPADFSSLG